MDKQYITSTLANQVDGVIISILASSAVDRVFEPQSGHIKDYTFGICCFSPKHVAFGSKTKNKYWFNWLGIKIMCPKWTDMSTRVLLI